MDCQATPSLDRTSRACSRARIAAETRTRHSWTIARALEVLALCAIAVLLILGVLASAAPDSSSPRLSEFTVQRGDTLWTIASNHPVGGLTTAQVADLIEDANQRPGALITPGEKILVPAGEGDERFAAREVTSFDQ